ncbi:hypothetical protein GCL60_02860 [Silvanigrella paludirubra]|uniref:Uncharacterized protein n=1 Tax=Silvanigrella paludirubra TaxID=2499159 RepID=A0A6N6VZU2_9BACT|nr:hypothetical protein [Silvanigrella paludirubra]KAB8040886.1 hypothetical protein GCL60_02860 [Silvanigrella paludirubra]
MKLYLILKIIIILNSCLIMMSVNAAFEVIYYARDCTQVKYHGFNTRYNKIYKGYVTSPIFDGRSNTFEFKSMDMNFKIFLEDTGNWALNAYLGSPDLNQDEWPYIKLNKTQIQVHGMYPKILMYSNHDGIYILDQDNNTFELMNWGHNALTGKKISYQDTNIDSYDYANYE